MDERFTGRVGLQQRVLPAYRAPFFDLLAAACAGGLSVFAGQPERSENVVVARPGDLLVAQHIPARNYHLFDPASPLCIVWQSGLRNWLQNWDPDVLVVEANPRTRSTLQALHWMHQRKRPVLGWGLGAPALGGRLSSWRARSRLRFIRQFDGLIAYSQRGAQEYLDLGCPAERVFVARNAVRPRPPHPLPARPDEFAECPVVLFVGRLQARKRIDDLLRACAALPAERQPRLVVVGDGPARPEFENLARAIYPQTEFTGTLRGAALETQFQQADLFVLPGTGGLAVQEAMTYALPVIVAEGDGTQDDLVRAENGWRIPSDDQAALETALQDALSDAYRLRRMGAESYRIVAGEVNLEAMVESFVRALCAAQGWGHG